MRQCKLLTLLTVLTNLYNQDIYIYRIKGRREQEDYYLEETSSIKATLVSNFNKLPRKRLTFQYTCTTFQNLEHDRLHPYNKCKRMRERLVWNPVAPSALETKIQSSASL